METKNGFTKLTVNEFEQWIKALRVARNILTIQEHHTYSPSYVHFNGANHFELQQGMRNYHVHQNGWSDIGQHFTTFPDGSILTGRSIEKSPACITGNNAHAICIENLGYFDVGKDVMTNEQRESIIRITAALCSKFSLPVNVQAIVYHHWFNLSTGERNDGNKNNKSCPGTNFFGGNKVADCTTNFLPLVEQYVRKKEAIKNINKYVVVNADFLNVRTAAAATSKKSTDRDPALLGAILRVYKEKDGWFKISSTKQHWVKGKFTTEVKKVEVIADVLNVRSGPGKQFPKIGALKKGQELFIIDVENGWAKLSMDNRWVSSDYLKKI
ncbi:MAG: SH3 domain-containing protein [Ferruginibacter sp.]